jgi:glucose/sorbosone dehydrogenase
MRVVAGTALWLSLSMLGAAGAKAVSLQPIGTFSQPIYVTSAPEDPDRLFVAERQGVIVEVEEAGSETFADLTSLVSCCTSERGLLSIAVAPDFATSGRIYAAYIGKAAAGGAEGDIHVDAFRHNDLGGFVREPIISVGHSMFANHNGGQTQFGPDDYLYISTGDGGGGGDPLGAGQSLSTLLGKILRIDPRPGDSPSYAIPPGNPFAGPGDASLDEIWAYGLRNPWRFSFDRMNGDLVIADVGQRIREEINYAPSPAPGVVGGGGANYGWDCREGTLPYTGPPGAPSSACGTGGVFTDPVFDYPHTDPEDGSAHGCSVTGGYVVRDASLGDLFGRYLYGDFCIGQLRSIDLAAPDPPVTERLEPGLSVSAFSLYSFGEDSCGRVYVVSGGGVVFRLEDEVPASCLPPVTEPPAEPVPPPGAMPPVPVEPLLKMVQRVRTHVKVAAARRQVAAGERALIVARVSPCAGREGQRVRLNKGGQLFDEMRIDRNCVARFRPRIEHRSTFRARVPGTGLYRPGRSVQLTIHPL